MFETDYPEPPEAEERYCDIPLGVEAAWPPPEELLAGLAAQVHQKPA